MYGIYVYLNWTVHFAIFCGTRTAYYKSGGAFVYDLGKPWRLDGGENIDGLQYPTKPICKHIKQSTVQVYTNHKKHVNNVCDWGVYTKEVPRHSVSNSDPGVKSKKWNFFFLGGGTSKKWAPCEARNHWSFSKQNPEYHSLLHSCKHLNHSNASIWRWCSHQLRVEQLQWHFARPKPLKQKPSARSLLKWQPIQNGPYRSRYPSKTPFAWCINNINQSSAFFWDQNSRLASPNMRRVTDTLSLTVGNVKNFPSHFTVFPWKGGVIKTMSKKEKTTLPETNVFAPKKGWLEY